MDSVSPPWSHDIISRLYKWQICGHYHPYTCGAENCREELTPTRDGWVCVCGYTQNWAHDPPTHEHFAAVDTQHKGFGAYVKDVYLKYALFILNTIKNDIKTEPDKLDEFRGQIYATFGDLMSANMGAVKKVLETFDVEGMHKELLLAMWTATLPVKHRFEKERREFIERVSEELKIP